MNAGIEILVARMESHPEEFREHTALSPYAPGSGRWSNLLHVVLDEKSNGLYFTREDIDAVKAKLFELRGNAFSAAVLDEITNGPERRQQASEKAQAAQQANQSSLNHTTLAQMRQMQIARQQEELERQMKILEQENLKKKSFFSLLGKGWLD